MSEIIHIGNQTALSAASLMLPFEYAIANGFDAFEWFPDGNASGRGWDESQIHQEMRSRIRTSAFASRVRLSVHAPWRANPLKPESLETLVRHLEFARDLGAVLVNIHLYPEAGLDAYVKAIEPLLRRLPEFGLRLSIENSPLTEPRLFNELFRRLTDLRPSGFEHVGMCLDLGHANLCEPTRNDYLQYIDLLDPEVRIIHIHLHENWGDFDTHLPIFTGPSATDGAGVEGFVERILKRNFSGSIILEQWPQPPALLNQARERLRGMLRQHLEDIRRPSPPRVQTELPSSHPPALDTPPAGTRLLPIKDNAIDQDSFIDRRAGEKN